MFGRLKWLIPLPIALAIGVLAARWTPPHGTRIAFLAVGQGDSTAIVEGHTALLIDVGPSGHGVDAGKRFVVPKLRELGVEAVALIFLTHPDIDHIGGLASVLKAYPDSKIAISACFAAHQGLRDHLREWKVPDEKVIWLNPQAQVTFGTATLEIACPPYKEGQNDNEGSLFIRLADHGATAIFTGDAPSSVEERMLRKEDWRAQILKVGHHGSRTSTSDVWLEAEHPSFAVISCGRNNPYGHPSPDVLQRLQSRAIPFWRTDQQGDYVVEERDGRFQGP